MDGPWVDALRHTLAQERLAAELDRNDLALRLGRRGDLLSGMRVLTDEHPLDERLAGQLMLALYRAGRQAEALDHYQRMRQRGTGLGADPGPALRELHAAARHAWTQVASLFTSQHRTAEAGRVAARLTS